VTFFQRFKTPFTESAADDQVRSQPRARLVGESLRERREDLGLDLDEIGTMLRIKPAYLAALEQGRSHDLPGPTYAIGFVRAYADFLGLDAEQVLARFKAEASGVTTRPDLALPVPLGERSLPGGALVLVALIVALCGYGIWYYLSTDERDRPQRVAAVPAALQAPTAAPVTPLVSAGGGGVGSLASVSPASPTPTPPASPTPPGAGPASSPAGVLAAPPIAAASPSVAVGPAAAAPSNSPGGNPRIAAITGRPAPTQPPPSTQPPTAPQPPAVQPTAATVPPPAPTRQANVAATPAGASPNVAVTPAPAAGVGTSPGTRIAIRALSDCWIQVRAPDQSIVFSRVLKMGEVYKVPSRAGLSLRTGNAGALEIAVDGKTAPAIGGVGTLRRDVALDPAALAQGTAVHG